MLASVSLVIFLILLLLIPFFFAGLMLASLGKLHLKDIEASEVGIASIGGP